MQSVCVDDFSEEMQSSSMAVASGHLAGKSRLKFMTSARSEIRLSRPKRKANTPKHQLMQQHRENERGYVLEQCSGRSDCSEGQYSGRVERLGYLDNLSNLNAQLAVSGRTHVNVKKDFNVHRHHGLNDCINQIMKRIPGSYSSSHSSKIDKLRRAIMYILYLEEHIQSTFQELGVTENIKAYNLSESVSPDRSSPAKDNSRRNLRPRSSRTSTETSDRAPNRLKRGKRACSATATAAVVDDTADIRCVQPELESDSSYNGVIGFDDCSTLLCTDELSGDLCSAETIDMFAQLGSSDISSAVDELLWSATESSPTDWDEIDYTFNEETLPMLDVTSDDNESVMYSEAQSMVMSNDADTEPHCLVPYIVISPQFDAGSFDGTMAVAKSEASDYYEVNIP